MYINLVPMLLQLPVEIANFVPLFLSFFFFFNKGTAII